MCYVGVEGRKVKAIKICNTLQKAKNLSTHTVSHYLSYTDVILG